MSKWVHRPQRQAFVDNRQVRFIHRHERAMRTTLQSLLPANIRTANLNPLHWAASLKQTQPIRKSEEESHELLSENESTNQTNPRWSQAPKYGITTFPLRNNRIRIFCAAILLGLVSFVVIRNQRSWVSKDNRIRHPWDDFQPLVGYYSGISNLVRVDDLIPENKGSAYPQHEDRASLGSARSAYTDTTASAGESSLHHELKPYQPQLRSAPATSGDGVQPLRQCFLDPEAKTPAPTIYAFEGVPQHGVVPLFGSYDVLGIHEGFCFERYGRYGPYGLGYSNTTGGSNLGWHGDQRFTEPIWKSGGQIDWRDLDLGAAQKQCYEQNQERFSSEIERNKSNHIGSLAEFDDEYWQQTIARDRNRDEIPRTAFVIRAWGGLEYTPGVRMYLRSLINELSLYSGGEYEVHLLVEVKDIHKPIWTSRTAYDKVLAELVPEEFRSMATLWSQELMELLYPGPFEPQFEFHGSMYPAMRSMHFALQWFMVQHPEFEYFWNWEMDIRYTGHWYELFDSVSDWAKKQPRDHLWAHSARYYVPALHGDWGTFVRDTAQRLPEEISPTKQTPAHTDQALDPEEEADLITYNPIFNPAGTFWNRRLDVTGYDTSLPIPDRRTSIIVAARFSRRLLLIMHNETYIQRHSMASEMFPPSMCLHHGLKAVFAPHPVYMERDWPGAYAEEIFNGGPGHQTGLYEDSVFGVGPKGNEDALKGTTYYYDSLFAGPLWRRWMGYKEESGGGPEEELRADESGNGIRGRMCLRSMLLHPVKWDVGPLE